MPSHLVARLVEADPETHDDAHERQRRATLQLLIARGCFFLCGYAAAVMLARQLGAADYGIYGVIISLLFWLEMLTNAGVPGATSKLIAAGRHDPAAVERSGRALLLGLSVLLFAVGWYLAPQVANSMRIPDGQMLLRIAILDLPVAGLYISYDGVLNGHRRFGAIALALSIYGITKLAAVVSLLGLGFTLERVLVANVIATSFICLILLVRYPPPGIRSTRRVVAEIASLAAPMGVYLIASQALLNLDLWSLKTMWNGGAEFVGQYVASVNLARTLTVIPAVQAGVLFAAIAWAVAARESARARRHVQEATRFALIIAVAAWVILGLNATEVLSVLFSDAYAGGRRFLPLQLAGFTLFALLDVFSHSLMAAGRQGAVAGALVATLPVAWLSNYFLIPRLGPLGAAISLLLGMALAVTITGAMAYHHFGSLIRASTLARVLIAAALVGLASAASQIHGPLLFLKLTLLGGLYLLVLRVLGEIKGQDFGLPLRGRGDPAS